MPRQLPRSLSVGSGLRRRQTWEIHPPASFHLFKSFLASRIGRSTLDHTKFSTQFAMSNDVEDCEDGHLRPPCGFSQFIEWVTSLQAPCHFISETRRSDQAGPRSGSILMPGVDPLHRKRSSNSLPPFHGLNAHLIIYYICRSLAPSWKLWSYAHPFSFLPSKFLSN